MALPRKYEGGDDDPLDVGELPPPTAVHVPIGVPVDYTATTTVEKFGPRPGYMEAQVKPKYFDGDELLPSQWSPDKILDLQRQLIAANLIPSGARVRLGVMDEITIDAYYKVLATANRYGSDWMMALDKLMGDTQEPGGGAAGQLMEVDEQGNLVPIGAGKPLPTRTTAPEDLRRVFRAVSIEQLGQGLSPDEIDSMVNSYQALEIQRQREAYAVEGTAKNVVSTPSPEAYAESYGLEQHPEEVKTEAFLGGMEDFLGMVGGWSSGQ